MGLFMINYDLRKQRNYSKLLSALKQQGAIQALESCWLLEANATPLEVAKWVDGLVDGDDGIIVAQTQKGLMAYARLNQTTDNYLMQPA